MATATARLVVLVDELRHLHQRPRDAHAQHQKDEQRARIRRVARRHRDQYASGERPQHREPLQRLHAGLDERDGHASFV